MVRTARRGCGQDDEQKPLEQDDESGRKTKEANGIQKERKRDESKHELRCDEF